MVTLNPDDMTPVINRLKRAQGQIGGVIRLIHEGPDRQDIANQPAAPHNAPGQAGYAIVSTGLCECLTNTGNPNPEEQAKMEKLFLTLS